VRSLDAHGLPHFSAAARCAQLSLIGRAAFFALFGALSARIANAFLRFRTAIIVRLGSPGRRSYG
jgi:hypothetical protein